MPKYLYSSSFATFVFDVSFRILLEEPFGELAIDYGAALSEGEWIKPEEQALKVHKEAIIVGFKKENKGLKLDSKTLSSIKEALRGRVFEIQNADVLLTKQLVKRSLSSDDIVIEASRGIRELEKDVNMLVKRLRGWYELYNPETSRSISDNEKFVAEILSKEKDELLAELKLTPEKSMGSNFQPHDLTPILQLATQASNMYKLKDEHKKYLSNLMTSMYPNLSAVASPIIAAELLASVGSLRRLAMMPSSTIQVLGAEKALFKHLRNKSIKPPKHGYLVNHPIMSKVPPEKRGRTARVLSDKISIACRIDFFKGEFIGEKLMKDVEDAVLK